MKLNVYFLFCRRGNVATQHTESRKKNLFLQSLSEEEQENVVSGQSSGRGEIEDKDIVECLEKDVTFWTDFSKVHYHPQSLYQLNGLWMDVQEFDNYGIGKESLSWSSQGEEIDERLRFFVEECDHIQVRVINFSFLLFPCWHCSSVEFESTTPLYRPLHCCIMFVSFLVGY